MISIKNILSIAHYESKVVWRNWFFRIVSLIGIFFVFVFNLAVFSEINTPRWYTLANSWMMPYSTMVMISIAQVATVIFLATGLVKKDKKLDTNEVFFVRPISNLDYVLGKALALFKLFFWLNFLLLCIPLVINLTNPNITFNPLAFVVYPLLISMPTIVFTTGISFLVVTLFRNQPISIVVLIGLSGVELIYFFDKYSNIFDFMAFRLQLYVSEMAGFVNLESVLWQRGFYLITGIAFLFLTAFFLDRLASHKRVKIFTGLIGLSILAVSTFMMFNIWEMRQNPIELRNQMISANARWASQPNVTILENSIDIEEIGNGLTATSVLKVRNDGPTALDTIYFSLNPGLTISEVSVDSKPTPSYRDLQIISINQRVEANETLEVKLAYQGTIWESIAHLEVDQERYESANDYMMFSMQKKYAFLQSDYVLLTKDVLWYPQAQVGYSREVTTKEQPNFTKFRLTVQVQNGQLPVSQGMTTVEGNVHKFSPENPLPQISLAVGNYVKKNITVDSIDYEVYHYPKNDYFVKHLDQLTDTLSYLITDLVNDYEDAQQLKYPFKRLQFVEAPVQFTAYNKIYESNQAYIQPETVYWPEEGGDMRSFDFRRQMRDMNRQAREENQVLTEKEKQANVFNDLIKKVFTKQIGSFWFWDGRNEDSPDYALFPNYYTYNSGVVSPEWALLNRSIATYLRKDKKPQNDFSRNFNGISFTEECNKLMREASLNTILTEENEFNKIQKSISLKGDYLFSYIGQLVGDVRFKTFLHLWIDAHRHQLTTYEDFRNTFLSEFGLDLNPIIQQVYSETSQPAFEILKLQKFEVLDGDRKRYQVIIEITNTGDNNGVVEIKFDTGDKSGDDRFFRRRVNQEPEPEEPGYLSVIRQGETKEIAFILDAKPNEITVDTKISRNIPSVITMPMGTMSQKKSFTLFEGERNVSPTSRLSEFEVVVDNEDPNFTTFSPIKATYLRAYLDSRNPSDQKYYGNWFRSYSKWLATTGSNFYGEVIRSAHFTRAGGGEKLATWTPELSDEGFYDIYIHLKGKNQDQYFGNDNRAYKYHYIINHGDGRDDITYDLSKAEMGWNYLGSYYFKKSGGSVQLTDECDLPTVYADAIKWVKQ